MRFMSVKQVERLLDQRRLQVCAGERWLNVRRNGATKRWVRTPRVSIPVKYGLYDAFRIEFDGGVPNYGLRAAPQF